MKATQLDSAKTRERPSARREPKQQRARQTVEAVLEAVRRVARRDGAVAITTNRVAEVAGVSIGSLYQYFPDKNAIFATLYDRHVESVRSRIERALTDCVAAPLEQFASELVLELANLHAEEAALHELFSSAAPHSDEGFARALHATFAQRMSIEQQDRYSADEVERMLFVLPPMVGALVHTVARQEHERARGRAKDEALRTVSMYLRSYEHGHTRRSTASTDNRRVTAPTNPTNPSRAPRP